MDRTDAPSGTATWTVTAGTQDFAENRDAGGAADARMICKQQSLSSEK